MAWQIVEFYMLENQIVLELNQVDEIARLHILNMHKPLHQSQLNRLKTLQEKVAGFVHIALAELDGNNLIKTESALLEVNNHFDHCSKEQMDGVGDGSFNFKNSCLFITTMVRLGLLPIYFLR